MGGGILLVDNFDSFTFTIADYLRKARQQVKVISRDKVTRMDVQVADGIVLSPGPGNPSFMPGLHQLIQQIPASKPMLGICLGFQALGVVCGSSLSSGAPMHGKRAKVNRSTTSSWLLENLPDSFQVVRYHSLYFTKCPPGWKAVLWTDDGILMAMEREDRAWAGVQYHPEAYLSEHGQTTFENWLKKGGLLSM